MPIDRTQSALEILKYFYDNAGREFGITISEIRKKVLRRTRGESRVWLRSKLSLGTVKDIVSIFLGVGFIEKTKPIRIKDMQFESYRITRKGMRVVYELRKTDALKELFNSILLDEVTRPT